MKKRFRQGAYDKDYRRFVKTVRSSSPASSCLLIGPPDLSTRPAGCFLSKKELRAKKGRSTRRKRAILKAKAMQRICRPDSLLNTQKRGRYRFPVPGVKNYKDWQSHKSRCAYRTHPSIRTLIATQKRIAHQAGCLYFDVYRYMGGAGSMHKWVCEYLPNLADLNHVNLTPVGYQRIGRAVVRDLDKAIIELVGIGLRGRKNAENAK